jgi:hypothetical protein
MPLHPWGEGMRYYKLLFILFLFLWLVVCRCAPARPATQTTPVPTAPSTPRYSPAPPIPSYVDGLSEIPAGQYLFIAVDSSTRCTPACNCPEFEIILPPYSYEPGELRLSTNMVLDGGTYLEWENLDPARPIVGLYSYCDQISHSELCVIDTLPFEAPDNQFTIHAVDSQGTLVVEGQGQTWLIKPEQGRRLSVTSEQGEDCRITRPYRLFNYGLLTKDQIHTPR